MALLSGCKLTKRKGWAGGKAKKKDKFAVSPQLRGMRLATKWEVEEKRGKIPLSL